MSDKESVTLDVFRSIYTGKVLVYPSESKYKPSAVWRLFARPIVTEGEGLEDEGDGMKMHCENHCTWKGHDDELVPDPDQPDEHWEAHGARYVCPICLTDGALVEDFVEEDTEGGRE